MAPWRFNLILIKSEFQQLGKQINHLNRGAKKLVDVLEKDGIQGQNNILIITFSFHVVYLVFFITDLTFSTRRKDKSIF